MPASWVEAILDIVSTGWDKLWVWYYRKGGTR